MDLENEKVPGCLPLDSLNEKEVSFVNEFICPHRWEMENTVRKILVIILLIWGKEG